MRGKGYIVVVCFMLMSVVHTYAQMHSTLTINNDHLILWLNLKSPAKEIDSVLKVAGITDDGSRKIRGGNYTVLSNDGWREVGLHNNVIQFERSLADINNNPQSKPYQVTTRLSLYDVKPGYPEAVKFGVNKFRTVSVYELASGLTRFILPGHQQSKRAFLSGSFNAWSTLKGLMRKADGGWILDIKLAPGAYEYKFIVDGDWMIDHNNLIEADDGAGNLNSLYFKYNYTFKLNGYPTAHRVTVAGNFDNWDGNRLLMEKRGNIWELPVFLADGSHTYHYYIDGTWITDPANPVKIQAEDGKQNSVLNLGEVVNFRLPGLSKAKNVYVAGSFNKWKPENLLMKRVGNDWVLQLTLPAGNYNYKFIADGNWMTDPVNQLYAVEAGVTNSFVAVKANHRFILKGHAGARSVKLVGNFTNWEKGEYSLLRHGDDWSIALYLKPGKYIYKFLVDDEWILDPGNKLFEPADGGDGNSVFWME